MREVKMKGDQTRCFRSSGYTLLEILIALAIAAIVLGAGASFFTSMANHRRDAATRARFFQEVGALQAMMQEDVSGAGAGTGGTSGGIKTVGRYLGREIPAVAVSGDEISNGMRNTERSLVVLRTGGTGGKVLAVNGATVVIATQTAAQWTALPAGAVVMFSGDAPSTSMTRLAAIPRLAVSSDVPGTDLSGCVTLQLNTAPCSCGPIESLDARAIAVGANVGTVTGAIKYLSAPIQVGTRSGQYTIADGTWRYFYQDCAAEPTPENKTLMSLNGTVNFTELRDAATPTYKITLTRPDWRGNPLGHAFEIGVDEWMKR